MTIDSVTLFHPVLCVHRSVCLHLLAHAPSSKRRILGLAGIRCRLFPRHRCYSHMLQKSKASKVPFRLPATRKCAASRRLAVRMPLCWRCSEERGHFPPDTCPSEIVIADVCIYVAGPNIYPNNPNPVTINRHAQARTRHSRTHTHTTV